MRLAMLSCRIAMARCVIGMAAYLNVHRQALGVPSPQGNGQALGGRDKCLQQCCTLYAEHLLTAEQPLSAAAVLENLPDTTQVSTDITDV
jgi:hypothetical protein